MLGIVEHREAPCSTMSQARGTTKAPKFTLNYENVAYYSTSGNIRGLNVRKYVIFKLQLSSNLVLASEQLFLEVTVQLYLNINI